MGGRPPWGWRRWVAAGAVVAVVPGAPLVWLTVWLLTGGDRGADVADVLALPVAVLGLMIGLVTLVRQRPQPGRAGQPPGRPDRPPDQPETQGRNGRRVAVRLGAAVALLAVLVLAATQLVPVGERVVIWFDGCPHPVQLRVLSSPEQLEPARRLAQEYELWTRERNHDCRRADVHVYAAPPGESHDSIVDAWADPALRDLGPQPDVWLADSAAQVDGVRRAVENAGITSPIIGDDVVARSPVVFGVGTGAAAELVDVAPGGTWADFVDEVTSRGWDLVRPDPVRSYEGLLGTALLYGDGTRAGAVEQRIDRSLDGDGYPIAGSLDVLCRYRQLGPPNTVAVITEQALARYNRGDPLGGGCGTRTAQRTGDDVLQAFYPSDTRGLGLRFVRLGWGGRLQQREAEAFGDWLTGEDSRQALFDAGLRPRDGQLDRPLSAGTRAAVTFSRDEITTAVLEAAMAGYVNAQRRGRVLLALDASGSMGAETGAGTRLTVAAEAVEHAVQLMGEHDEFGLSVFPADGSGTGLRPAVPIGKKDDPVDGVPRLEAIDRALEQVRPGGSTPLYEAVVEGVKALGQYDMSWVNALIVLTDGEDETHTFTPGQVREAAVAARARVFVIAVGGASCAGSGLGETVRATGGLCFDAGLASIDIQLSELFGTLWGETG